MSFCHAHPDNQPIYCTWYRNDAVIEQLSIRKNDFFIFENGTLRLPPNEKATGAYRCKIEWDESAVISDLITVEYPGEQPAQFDLTSN